MKRNARAGVQHVHLTSINNAGSTATSVLRKYASITYSHIKRQPNSNNNNAKNRHTFRSSQRITTSIKKAVLRSAHLLKSRNTPLSLPPASKSINKNLEIPFYQNKRLTQQQLRQRLQCIGQQNNLQTT